MWRGRVGSFYTPSRPGRRRAGALELRCHDAPLTALLILGYRRRRADSPFVGDGLALGPARRGWIGCFTKDDAVMPPKPAHPLGARSPAVFAREANMAHAVCQHQHGRDAGGRCEIRAQQSKRATAQRRMIARDSAHPPSTNTSGRTRTGHEERRLMRESRRDGPPIRDRCASRTSCTRII